MKTMAMYTMETAVQISNGRNVSLTSVCPVL